MTLVEFRVKHPEFQNADDALLQAHIDAADLRISVTVWGAQAKAAHSFLAASTLARSPWGRNARLAAKDGETVYDIEYRRMQREVASGARVT